MSIRRSLAAGSAAVLLAAPSGRLDGAVPTPESHFGHVMGADRSSLEWARVVSYFQALARSSPRVRIEEIGASVGGRPMIAAVIAAPETLRNLDRYRSMQKALADPRRTTPAEAERLIAQGKSIVLITCAIHSTEVASTHTAVEFAHRMATANDKKTRRILDETIFLLVPSLNPDGTDIVTAWYRKTLGTPWEGTSPPELYHKYLGHDNNRDWYIFTQPETRNTISRLHNVWHPQIVFDVHQQGPNTSRMFVPPWLDPIDPNVDPIIAQQSNMIGMGMALDLTAAGKKGVAVNAMYDFWTPARHYQAYHGGVRILSESASARLSSPITVQPDEIQETALGYSPRVRSWNHLEPWEGGEWRLRDIVDYQLIAMESCLYQAAIRREDLLRNFYRVGRRAVERTSPYAFVLPAEQHDPGAARKLIETLAFGLVEVETAKRPFRAGSREYPAGSFVIRMQQPYSAFAKTLLERQQYPDLRLYPGGPPRRPYDVTAHTLPLLMGVDVDAIADRFQADLAAAGSFQFALAKPRPQGVLAASDGDTWIAVNRAWKNGRSVWRNGVTGDFRFESREGFTERRRPRLGLYKSFAPSMDEGWTRWILEQFGFDYVSVGNGAIQAGELRTRYDVLLFPDQPAATIASGYPEDRMPPEYTGGLGERGAASLKRFAEQGGKLIFLNHSTEYASGHLEVGVRNALAGLSIQEYYSPGSLLNVWLNPESPLALGLPERIAIWSEGSPAWTAGQRGRSAVQYPESGVLASGWLLGEKHLAGKSAIMEVPLGEGRVILFGMRPQYRAQSYQAFKLLFNAFVE
ncbi:MAG: M14 metallopeptidase family protein [Bryobacteraceae bacterium]